MSSSSSSVNPVLKLEREVLVNKDKIEALHTLSGVDREQLKYLTSVISTLGLNPGSLSEVPVAQVSVDTQDSGERGLRGPRGFPGQTGAAGAAGVVGAQGGVGATGGVSQEVMNTAITVATTNLATSSSVAASLASKVEQADVESSINTALLATVSPTSLSAALATTLSSAAVAATAYTDTSISTSATATLATAATSLSTALTTTLDYATAHTNSAISDITLTTHPHLGTTSVAASVAAASIYTNNAINQITLTTHPQLISSGGTAGVSPATLSAAINGITLTTHPQLSSSGGTSGGASTAYVSSAISAARLTNGADADGKITTAHNDHYQQYSNQTFPVLRTDIINEADARHIAYTDTAISDITLTTHPQLASSGGTSGGVSQAALSAAISDITLTTHPQLASSGGTSGGVSQEDVDTSIATSATATLAAAATSAMMYTDTSIATSATATQAAAATSATATLAAAAAASMMYTDTSISTSATATLAAAATSSMMYTDTSIATSATATQAAAATSSMLYTDTSISTSATATLAAAATSTTATLANYALNSTVTAQIDARVPASHFDTLGNHMPTLNSAAAHAATLVGTGGGGTDSATTTLLVESVGTKPTTGLLMTEVELGALLHAYSKDELILGAGSYGIESGYAIALSKDGKWLAICSRDGVCVYYCDYSGSFTKWGADISISNIGNLSVALSRDGVTLVIGNPSAVGVFPAPNLPNSGEVLVFQKPATVNAAWVYDSSLYGGSGLTGSAVAMNSSGTVIAVGAPGIDVDASAQDVGHVRVWTRASEGVGTWTQKANTILGGAAGDESGSSLALSENGLTVSVGSPKYDGEAPDPTVDYSTHRFFGFAPTERAPNAAGCLFGFSITQAPDAMPILSSNFHGTAIGIPNDYTALAPADAGAYPSWTLQGAAAHPQGLQAYICFRDGWTLPWDGSQAPMWWEMHQQPLFYVESADTPNGSELTCTFQQYVDPATGATQPTHFHPAGNIVSAATAAGPWVVRATFDASTGNTGVTTLALNGGAPPHRYFGIVPTETHLAQEQWFLWGFEIQDSGGNNILPASTAEQHVNGDTVFEMPHDYPNWVDPNWYSTAGYIGWDNHPNWMSQGSPAKGTIAYDSYAAQHGGVTSLWEHGVPERTSYPARPAAGPDRPVMYAYSSAPVVDGELLTARIRHYTTAHWAPNTWAIKGHIVSSATGAPGTWEIRGTWDLGNYPDGLSGYPTYEYVNTPLAAQAGSGAQAMDRGAVRVYDYNESTNVWLARHMAAAAVNPFLVGDDTGDNMGDRRCVAMSDDGMIVAVGTPHAATSATGEEGEVAVFVYSNATQQYIQRAISAVGITMGTPIQQIGVVSMSSEGTFLTVGGCANPLTSGPSGGAGTSGIVRTYRWDGLNAIYQLSSETTSIYANLPSYSSTNDMYGFTVAMSGDGMTFAVGAPSAGPDQSADMGLVRVWRGVDSSQQDLTGRTHPSVISTLYATPEWTAWNLLDMALKEIGELKARLYTIETHTLLQ